MENLRSSRMVAIACLFSIGLAYVIVVGERDLEQRRQKYEIFRDHIEKFAKQNPRLADIRATRRQGVMILYGSVQTREDLRQITDDLKGVGLGSVRIQITVIEDLKKTLDFQRELEAHSKREQ